MVDVGGWLVVGWWLVVVDGGCWLVVGGWWLVVGGGRQLCHVSLFKEKQILVFVS